MHSTWIIYNMQVNLSVVWTHFPMTKNDTVSSNKQNLFSWNVELVAKEFNYTHLTRWLFLTLYSREKIKAFYILLILECLGLHDFNYTWFNSSPDNTTTWIACSIIPNFPNIYFLLNFPNFIFGFSFQLNENFNVCLGKTKQKNSEMCGGFFRIFRI